MTGGRLPSSGGARPPIRAVTLDLDDTLFPQASWLAGAWHRVAEAGGRRGVPVAALLAALQETAARGSDRGGIIDAALGLVGADLALVPELVGAFAGHAPEVLPYYPGAEDALRRLRAHGLLLAVVTDGNPTVQRAKVAALGVERLVDTVVISDELGGRAVRKPHPAAFVEALRRIGVSPAAAVHVGDRPAKDCAGAQAAGLPSVRVRTGEYVDAPDGPCPPWFSAVTLADAVDRLLAPAA
ncbi:MAG: HAD-superfamily hydrolase, subfamily variant 1 [Frankiales bacterium]|jgi:putative hydrolase of the HAD superfamily|nr:HAD-superfamily hydrolase, subfamily variant 1 [Frankiales bacterium]